MTVRWHRYVALTLCGVLMGGCARQGFNGRPEAGVDTYISPFPDNGSGLDLCSEAGCGPLPFFVQRTVSTAPETFSALLAKPGRPVIWDWGDGSAMTVGNGVSHVYGDPGEKEFSITSPDGPLEISLFDLSDCGLVGPLSPAIAALEGLRILRAPRNQLSGSLPLALTQIRGLRQLELNANQLSGAIPAAIAALQQLTALSLAENQLEGQIPDEVGTMTQLTGLLLYNNQLSGAIPASLGQLSNLVTLFLQGNRLSGAIPRELGRLERLSLMQLSGNRLTGLVPVEFANLSELTVLDLSNNELSGVEAGALTGLHKIARIDLSSNALAAAAVDAIVDEVYRARSAYALAGDKLLDLGGTNATPGAAAKAQIAELVANWGWLVSCSGGCS